MAVTGPLEGIRVLDLTVALAGPLGSLLLGGLGAEVIRVESPGGGDIARNNPPYVGKDGIHFGVRHEDEVSLTTLNRARNKKSVTLNLKTEQGRALFMELAKECDVLIENASEGTTARLGVDYESVRKANPKIIYASVKAFGEPSPYPKLKGMDIIVQALSGIMDVTGVADGPPTRWALPIADMVAPLYAVNGILAALIHRGKTGEGQCVQVSMLDCLASLVAEEHFDVFMAHGYPKRSGNFHDRLVPFGVYGTSDGHVAMVAFQPDWFGSLMQAIGKPELAEDPRYATRGAADEARDRDQRHDRGLDAPPYQRRSHTRAAGKARRAGRAGALAPGGAAGSGIAATRRGGQAGAPGLANIDAMGMGLPIQFSGTPSSFGQPAQELGASNNEIYQGLLKLSDAQLDQLRGAGVI